jgi:transcriptional regulator with XRE-family HTH domain
MHRHLPHFILDRERFLTALAKGGYASLTELASAVGVHRNSLSNYLNGAQIFPEVLEKAMVALRVEPASVIKTLPPFQTEPERVIGALSDAIARKDDHCCVVLFGSRARGRPKRFSDYDLGVYNPSGIPFSDLSLMLSCVDDFNDETMQTAQLTNISEADGNFLTEIGPDLQFLAGSRVAWTALRDKIQGMPHAGYEAR